MEGTRLKVKMVLRPSFHGLLCTGIVIDARSNKEKDASKPYFVTIKFVDIDDYGKKLLQQHVLQTQAQNLQKEL